MNLNVVIRFSGVVTFVEQEDSVVVLVPNLTSSGDLRIPRPTRRSIKRHYPKLRLLKGKVCGGGQVPDPEHRHFRLEDPWGSAAPSLGDLGLVNVTEVCRDSSTIDARLKDCRLSHGLLDSPHGDHDRKLVISRFRFRPGEFATAKFPHYWRLRHGPPQGRKFIRCIEVRYARDFSAHGPVRLGHRPLAEKVSNAVIQLKPDHEGGSVVLAFSNDCSGCGEPGDHFAAHCNLMANPVALRGRFPVPEPIPGLLSSVPLDPLGNNPQCSPAQLSV